MKFVVTVGSYERILYGIDVSIIDADGIVKMDSVKESYAMPAHMGYVKSVASCSKFLVSGGTDETIRIFDLKKRKDIGSLSQHDGSVAALAFAGSTHLLTGGEDGRIGLFRTKDWECLHVLQNKKPVRSITVHPTGRFALSVGKDRSMRLWNLMTGRQAYSLKLSHEPLRIVFSQSGKFYAILSDFHVQLYETEGNRHILEFKSKTRLATIALLKDEKIFIAGEGTLVQMIDIASNDFGNKGEESSTTTSKDQVVSAESFETGQTPRIKDMAISSSSKFDILFTGSSSGMIKGWNISVDEKKPIELFSHNSSVRITCLTATL